MNSKPGGRRKILAGITATIAIPLLSACAGTAPPPAPPQAPPPATSSPAPAADPPTTTPEAPSTTAEPPASDPPTTAADGRNYSACATRPCEVSVSGATRIPVPGGTLRVTGVTSRGLTLEATVDGSESSGTLTGCGGVLEVGNGSTGLSSCRDDKKVTPLAPPPGTLDIQDANKIGNVYILRIARG